MFINSNNITKQHVISGLLLVMQVKNWLVFGLFKDYFSTAQVGSNCMMIVNNKVEIMLKEAIVIYFKIVSLHKEYSSPCTDKSET
jgi:hypothetical protein